MLELETLELNRAIMHKIKEKDLREAHSRVIESNEVVFLSDKAKEIIVKRLHNTIGLHSRAFDLDIKDDGSDSFFNHFLQIESSDESFVESSKNIAAKLAESQTRSLIPDSFLIILEGIHTIFSKRCLVLIKAEPHEAIRQVRDGLSTILEVLDNVILSPSQKLFKIGVIYERPTHVDQDEFGRGLEGVNKDFGGIVFDEQISRSSKPSEYFFKDFLGFSIANNSKYLTRGFYNYTEIFINSNIRSLEEKDDALKALKVYIKSNDQIIRYSQFADNHLPAELISRFKGEAEDIIPSAFVKNLALISTTSLDTKKVKFPNKVTISVPEEFYGDKVKMFTNISIGDEDLSDPDCTWVKIKGLPFHESARSTRTRN